MPVPLPLEIRKTDPHEITVWWDDEHTSVFTTKYLRSECTCAGCVSEITGKRILDPDTVPENITVLNAEHVGRYGVKFVFSDYHDDGIYTWTRLREICSCTECSRDRDEKNVAGHK